MNVTSNFTDIIGLTDSLEDGDIPLVESMESGEDDHVGFSIENSLLKIIPKFFKAIVTLLISGLLLGMTFLLISLWKRGYKPCRTHRKLEDDSKPRKKHHGAQLHSVIVTPPEEDEDEGLDRSTAQSGSSVQPVRSKYMKVPKQALLRRASGPFGSDVLSFVGEQYTMKNIEREGHHHHSQQGPHGHGGRTSPHLVHFHGGHSSTGSTQQQQDEEGGGSSSKWNCFKGNKS